MTNFGMFSRAQMINLSRRLQRLGTRFYFYREVLDEALLREWFAWDPSALKPTEAYNLWIQSSHLPKIGNMIVELYPERKFGAP